MTVRWVGFDMDECIGSVMPLYTYIEELPHCRKSEKQSNHLFIELANTLYDSETNKKTWLLRPAMMNALELLYSAWKNVKIQGAFVYSNNGSANLVRFVALWMNVCIKRMYNLRSIPGVFQMAIWNNAPCRQPYGNIKSFESIQACLDDCGLPECSSANDLLFFDDMPHILQYEIPYYVKVPPYFNHTPAMSVIEALSSIQRSTCGIKWTILANKSLDQQMHDFNRPDNRYIMKPQTLQEYSSDIAMYRNAFRAFLNNRR